MKITFLAKMVRFRPGKLAYLSESDNEVEKEKTEPTKQCAASSKRGSPRTPAIANHQISQSRSSERIQRKQSRSFEKPTRQELLSKIDSLKSPSKMLDRLKPRRLVNDFTKETHRYNYDPDYTSGESSIDDFIDDDNEDLGSNASSSSEERSLAEEMPSPVPPKKTIHHSDDDDQTSSNSKESKVTKRKFTKTKVKGAKFTKIKVKGSETSEEKSSNSDDDEQLNISSESRTTKTSIAKANLSDSNDEIVNSSKKTRVILSSSDADSSGSDVLQPGKRKNLKRRPENGETASSRPSDIDDSIMEPRRGVKRKRCTLGESSEASDENADNDVEYSSVNTDDDSEDRNDETDSESEVNEHNSSRNKTSSRYGHFHSHRAELMQRKRDKKRRLFSKLIQTRRRNNSNGNLSAV